MANAFVDLLRRREKPLALAAGFLVLVGSAVVHGLWTDRWDDGRDLEHALGRLDAIPLNVGLWQGRELELDGRVMRRGRRQPNEQCDLQCREQPPRTGRQSLRQQQLQGDRDQYRGQRRPQRLRTRRRWVRPAGQQTPISLVVRLRHRRTAYAELRAVQLPTGRSRFDARRLQALRVQRPNLDRRLMVGRDSQPC